MNINIPLVKTSLLIAFIVIMIINRKQRGKGGVEKQ